MNAKPEIKEDGTLSYQVWWKTGGGGMINRDCLEHDHPQQTYNYLKSHGIKPEKYGIQHPLINLIHAEFQHKTRDELAIEILALRKEITELNRMIA